MSKIKLVAAPGVNPKAHTVEFETSRNAFFVVCDGVRIAKRGHPGTPQVKKWIPLGPGWEVLDVEGGIEVRFEGNPVIPIPGSTAQH
jgi:hypothetical protein